MMSRALLNLHRSVSGGNNITTVAASDDGTALRVAPQMHSSGELESIPLVPLTRRKAAPETSLGSTERSQNSSASEYAAAV